MKKLLANVIALTSSTPSFAGPGHGHSHEHEHGHSHDHMLVISKKKTIEIGEHHIERLIKAGKLDSSWEDAKFENSEKKKFDNKTEWVVTFNNAKGVKGKKLYIFLKLSGEFIAANFTGK